MTPVASAGVRVRDLTISYGDTSIVHIPALDLAPGSYTLVTGPTGCGKSSIALALAGVLEEMTGARLTGDVSLDGAPLTTSSPSGCLPIAAVWQNPQAQLFRASILDEVRAGLDVRLVPGEEGDRRAREALRLVGLDHLDERRDPLTLSGGEQQRLALAAALVLDAPLLILDEAASQLDRKSSERLGSIVAGARAERGFTVLAFDHRPDPHLAQATRVVVLAPTGRILLDGTPADVYDRHAARCHEVGIRVPTRHTPAEAACSTADSAAASPGLVVRELTVRRGRRDRNQAPLLREVSFDLPTGAVALLVGPNGSGKSTLLSALAGLPPRAEGRIEPSRKTRRRRGIGYAPQRGADLLFTRTVREELCAALPAARARRSSASVPDLDALLDHAGLLDVSACHPQRLSGGQRQRLSAVLATAGSPGLLLLDEPTNAQDARGAAQVLALIRQGSHQRVTVIATHEEELFRGLATHRIEMRAGAVGSVEDL